MVAILFLEFIQLAVVLTSLQYEYELYCVLSNLLLLHNT